MFKTTFKKYLPPFLAGALLAFAFAPISLVGLGIISLAWLFYQLVEETKSPLRSLYKGENRGDLHSFKTGWIYGFGLFAAGASWIYVSIHTYGRADVFSSILVTFLFCLFMGLYYGLFALSFSVYSRLLKTSNLYWKAFNFSMLWVGFEYLRATLFTGFPWLMLGFSQIVTPMKYLAPIIGVYGLSWLTAFSGALLSIIWIGAKNNKNRVWKSAAFGLLALYFFPIFLSFFDWTTPVSSRIPVSVIQGNIGEDEKWLPHAYEKTITHYVNLTREVLDEKIPSAPPFPKPRIIVWPEGAIPVPYPHSQDFLTRLSIFMAEKNATLVTGIPYQNSKNNQQYYNAMLLLGKNDGHYFKHHIVPFGEYFPAKVFHEIMDWLGVSLYETGRGGFNQPLLNIHDIPTLPFICYEIAYADILFNALPKAQLFITISDDAWFGHSLARAQHLQIAQMRSLQAGRYQIVATNNGISAVINEEGTIIKTVPSFETRILNSTVKAMSGSTPWSKMGDNVFLLTLICLWLLTQLLVKYRSRDCQHSG